MDKEEAKELIEVQGNKCPECKNKSLGVVEGFINIGNYFLRCKECGFEYDN